jgi:hypothetical protein
MASNNNANLASRLERAWPAGPGGPGGLGSPFGPWEPARPSSPFGPRRPCIAFFALRLAARLDERRHQCALLDLSQTIPHCGFAYLSRTARPTKDEDRGSAPANSSPHDNALRRQCAIFYALKVAHHIIRRAASTAASAPARRSLGRPATTASTTKRECS